MSEQCNACGFVPRDECCRCHDMPARVCLTCYSRAVAEHASQLKGLREIVEAAGATYESQFRDGIHCRWCQKPVVGSVPMECDKGCIGRRARALLAAIPEGSR